MLNFGGVLKARLQQILADHQAMHGTGLPAKAVCFVHGEWIATYICPLTGFGFLLKKTYGRFQK